MERTWIDEIHLIVEIEAACNTIFRYKVCLGSNQHLTYSRTIGSNEHIVIERNRRQSEVNIKSVGGCNASFARKVVVRVAAVCRGHRIGIGRCRRIVISPLHVALVAVAVNVVCTPATKLAESLVFRIGSQEI